jgi:hypothetical protein
LTDRGEWDGMEQMDAMHRRRLTSTDRRRVHS